MIDNIVLILQMRKLSLREVDLTQGHAVVCGEARIPSQA